MATRGLALLLTLAACTAELPDAEGPINLVRAGSDAQVGRVVDAFVADDSEVDAAADPDLGIPDAALDPDARPTPDAARSEPDAAPPEPDAAVCACPGDEVCVGGACEQGRWVFEAEDPAMQHDTGEESADGWAAFVLRDDLAAFLQRGPFTRVLPPARYEATFRLRIGPYLGDYDVLILDVNDSDGMGGTGDCALCSLDTRTLRSSHFPEAFEWQEFTVAFQLVEPGHRLEFRTFFIGTADAEIARVEVRRLPE